MEKKKMIAFIGVLVLVAALIAGVNSFGESDEVIKIGFVGPLSGPVSYTGNPVKNGFELSHSQNVVSESGRRIEISYEDGKCSPTEALSAARKFMDVDGVEIIVSGVCSSSTLAIAPVAEEQGKILISPVAASPAVSDAGDYVFRISMSSELLGSEAARIARDMGYTKVAVLYEMNEYPTGWKNVFEEEFESLGGSVVTEESFNSGETDMRTQLMKIEAAKPELILVAVLSAPAATNVLKEVEELGIETPLLGNELFSYKSILNSGLGVAEGMFVTTYNYDVESVEMETFLSDYEIMYNKPVTEEIYAALGYDLYNLLYEAINECDDDPECIQDYLNDMGEKNGVSGKYALDENGDAIRDVVVRKIVGGKLVRV